MIGKQDTGPLWALAGDPQRAARPQATAWGDLDRLCTEAQQARNRHHPKENTMTDTDTDTDTDTAPTRASASARIAAGLAVRPREHHGKRLAEAFRHDAAAERMLKLRESRPEAYAALPASTRTRTGLAYYSGAREAARALGRDVSAPAGTS